MSCKLPMPWGWFAAALLTVSVAVAQQNQRPDGSTYTPGTFYPPYSGGGGYYGGYGGGWGESGGTVAGNYLTGLSRTIRAQGQYNLDTSAATINLAEARKREIDNRKQWTNTYFEMRKINRAYRDAARRPRGTPETWVRLAQEAAPNRLSPGELDPVTGRIAWPPGLMGNEFKSDREKLDPLFADRALKHGAIGVETHARIRDNIDQMFANLKARIRQYNTNQYLASRNFLTSLRYEATLPTTGYAETASRAPVPPPVRAN